jgi:hypothetical protein
MSTAKQSVESYRKAWNKQQKELRRLLDSPDLHAQAIELFLSQHAMLHSCDITRGETWSYADEVFASTNEELLRRIPNNEDHSILWAIWHIARIEDVTMNLLVADNPQIFLEGDWQDRMEIEFPDTGNAMSPENVVKLSETISIPALRAYRSMVGIKTREIVTKLQPQEVRNNVSPSRLQQVIDDGAVVEAASGILDYWGKRTIAGLLLMPPTRHNFIHLNEAFRIKKKS